MHLICSIYRSTKKEGMYLYVNKKRGLEVLPKELTELFGPPVHVVDLLLRPERQLARVDMAKVRQALQDKGWFLQLPPPPDEDLYLAEGYQGA